MSVNNFTTAFSQVAVGDRISGSGDRAAFLSASSSDVITAGMGVDLASGAIAGGYKPLIALPSSASGQFVGIVPRAAIPTAEEAALLGSTAGQLYPGKAFSAFRFGVFRVPITANVTANNAAYLVFSGANAGKWAPSTGAVSQVTRGTVVPNNGDAVGLDVDSLPRIEVTSTASASGTATLIANAWNASAQHYAVAVASTDTNDVLLTFVDDQAHTVTAYSPATADVTPIANDTAAVAATARAVSGAFFRATTTGASGAGVLELLDQ